MEKLQTRQKTCKVLRRPYNNSDKTGQIINKDRYTGKTCQAR